MSYITNANIAKNVYYGRAPSPDPTSGEGTPPPHTPFGAYGASILAPMALDTHRPLFKNLGSATVISRQNVEYTFGFYGPKFQLH